MMSYKHLSLDDRIVIKNMRNLGYSLSEIATQTGHNKSTISRELKRNYTLWYRPAEAHKLYLERKSLSGKRHIEKHPELKKYILDCLKLEDSPEQIAGRIVLEYPDSYIMRISHESIYQWIYFNARIGDETYKLLRRVIKKRRCRTHIKSRRMMIPDRKSIHTRPAEVETRSVSGHWEGDTIVGKGHSGYIATMVERVNLYLTAALMRDKRPSSLNRATLEAFGDINNNLIKTITLDNGTEFCDYKDLEEALECEIYFADPYSSWQRGTNENTNGLLRQYFPKIMSFESLTQNDVDRAVEKLNNRPRKKLKYRTPYEVFNNLPVALRV